LMSALPGTHPHQSGQSTADVVAHLARGLRGLHALSVGDCPFDETIAARLMRARTMIEQGSIDGGEFAERNRGRSPQQIYEQLMANASRVEEDIVLVHGDAKFDNLLVDGDGRLGFIDCGHCGRGDSYLDLEAITSDIAEYFGPPWTAHFATCYGEQTLDAAKLRFFSDLYELF
jgi:aminoglycoside phosphotransferase